MKFLHLLLLTFLIHDGICCTFPANMNGTWTSNAYGTITVTSDYLTLGEHSFSINGIKTSNWTCFSDATSPYIILQSELFHSTSFGTDMYAYICMNATEVNVNSFYFYMDSPIQNLMENERIVLIEPAATPGDIAAATCTGTPSTAEFISMVRTGSEESALVDCPDPLHRNFTYVLNTGSSDLCTSDSFVSVCPSRQEVELDYSKCSTRVFYSAEGRVGCIATIDDGSGTQYASLYNFDATVSFVDTFRFACVAVEDVLSGDVSVSYARKRCDASQAFNAIPTSGGRLTLTPNGTCEITTTTEMETTETTVTTTEMETTETTETTEATTTESPIPVLTTDSVNVGAIIGGVLAAIIFIFLLLFIILYCIHRKKVIAKQREIIDRRLRLFKIKQAQGLDDDEKVLTEPSLDPDFAHKWEAPKQELIPPVQKTITRDMMSQTDLRKEPKKKPPPPKKIEIPPPAPTPKYLPWPWRTAKRASQKSAFQSQTDLNKFGPLEEREEEVVNLASYTQARYGLQYDDTGVDDFENKISRPPTRFIPRAQSIVTLSRANSRITLSRSKSVASLNRSQSVTDLTTPTPRTVQLTRAPSMHSLRSFTERTQTNVLMSIQEKKDTGRETERRAIYNNAEETIRPIPHYMFPVKSNTVTKFDKTKNQNPLSRPLKRSKSELRPIPGQSKKSKSKSKKKKKIKVKKMSPYAPPKPAPRQVTLIPLSLQKSTKVRPSDIQKKPVKLMESPDTSSPKTMDSDIKSTRTTETFFTQSPDTAISSINTDSVKTKTFIADNLKTEQTPIENSTTTDNSARVKSYRTATTDFQDSGISADESSLDNQKSDSATDGELKLPKLSVPQQPDKSGNKPNTAGDSVKLPFLDTKQKSSVRPWR